MRQLSLKLIPGSKRLAFGAAAGFAAGTVFILFLAPLLAASGQNGLEFLRDRFRGAAYPEKAHIESRAWTFDELVGYLREISGKKGAEYSYGLLIASKLPPGLDQHLLGHEVGYDLYKQKGIDGIYSCTPDLRNACSHAIVVNYLYEHEEKNLADIAAVCRKAPGGKIAYSLCIHGLGHGVLAYMDYDLEKTVPLCQSLDTGKREGEECIGGAIMEMVGGGFHDRDAWLAARKKYFKDSDPLYPCSADFMPKEFRNFCYIYLTPHLFDPLGIKMQKAGPDEYRKAMEFCKAIPSADQKSRRACFGGFGKEFTVLALQNNIKGVAAATEDQIKNVYEWCMLTDDAAGRQECVFNAVSSFLWGGENDEGTAIRFCSVLSDPRLRSDCFSRLINNALRYAKNREGQERFCARLPQAYQEACAARLPSSQ